MAQRREIKQRSPAVWARVQEAYLAGEPAASVARRFDVGIGNLRYRANAEGWTRKAAMAAAEREAEVERRRLDGAADRPLDGGDPDGRPLADRPRDEGARPTGPIDPQQAVQAAVSRAADLIGRGLGAEAMTLLKAAEALGRITGERGEGPPAEPGPPTAEAAAAKFEAQKEMMEAVHEAVRERADTLAFDLLTDRGPPQAAYGAFAFRWRAWVLGPEVALSDFRAWVHGGWASRYWDAGGRLLEVDPIPPRPDLLMVTQHLRRCQGVDWGQEDLTGWRWPPRDWWGEEEEGEGVVVGTEAAERGPRVRGV